MAAGIPMGSDFLRAEFSAPEDVARHVRLGDVTGFCTGSPGTFELKFRNGYPSADIDRDYPVSIRLGIQVSGGELRESIYSGFPSLTPIAQRNRPWRWRTDFITSR